LRCMRRNGAGMCFRGWQWLVSFANAATRDLLALRPGHRTDVGFPDWDGPVERVHAEGFQSGGFRAVGTIRVAGVGSRGLPAWHEERTGLTLLLEWGSYASVGPVVAARWLGVPAWCTRRMLCRGAPLSFWRDFGRDRRSDLCMRRKQVSSGGRAEITVFR